MIKKNKGSSGRIEGLHFADEHPVSVEYENGIITRVQPLTGLSDPEKKLIVSPGLIDIQINGHSSVSFALEGAGGTSALKMSDIEKVTRALWKEGVTTYFPTLTTNSPELFLRNISILAEAMNDPSLSGSIPGLHLEGPYISPVDGFRGAHPKEYVRKPDWDEFRMFCDAAGNRILIVTVAPEIEGIPDFIEKCRDNGIVVSLGHHNGSAEEIRQAVDRGARLSTHLGNGIASTIHRHVNPIWPQLADDRLNISFIADGFHLPPEILKVFFRIKGPEKIIMTSDITSYAGLPPGVYEIKTGETIEKTPDGNLKFSGQAGGLYGSASTLSWGIGHILKVTGCSLGDAIRMTSINPAMLHRLEDRGGLEPGKRADIILFSMENYNMQIKKTIVSGRTVFNDENVL